MPRLIDADKSTEILKKLLYETALNNSGEASMMCADIAEHRLKTWVDLVPTEAEPIKHGQWIFNPKDAIEMMFTLPKCSECGAESPDAGNYCPHCGAKMDA